MLLVLQHPFGDLRKFATNRRGLLARPAWPFDSDGFLRSCGPVRFRNRGGIDDWAGEEIYGGLGRALRFKSGLGRTRFGSGVTVTNSFRRFHTDGTVARVDIGFALDGGCNSVIDIVRDLAEMTVCVGRHKDEVELVFAGSKLAQHLLHATTRRKPHPAPLPAQWWFGYGHPLAILEYPSNMPIALPVGAKHVAYIADADASLSHAFLGFGNMRCSTWFIARGTGDPDAVRRVRMHLSRLHSELECMRLVLRALSDDQKLALDDGIDAVQISKYLSSSISAIQKVRRFGHDQQTIVGAVIDAIGTALPGRLTSMTQMRIRVRERVESYIQQCNQANRTAEVIIMNTYKGPVLQNTVGSQVQIAGENAKQQAQSTSGDNAKMDASMSETPDPKQLEAAIEDLKAEVAKLMPQLPPEDAAVAKTHFDNLVSEVVKEKPRKGWYDVSAAGLIEAAKTVSEMTPSITKTVKALLGLFV